MFSEALQKFENEGNAAWVTAIRLVPFQHLLDTEIIFECRQKRQIYTSSFVQKYFDMCNRQRAGTQNLVLK